MNELKGMTIEEINYRLRHGLMGSDQAEEVVKWWNENRVSTSAELKTFQLGQFSVPQIVISDL